MINSYSPTWFSLFLDSIQPNQTETEINFLTRHLPNPPDAAILDICCGSGRHANLLAARGYQVTGIDLDRTAIEKARQQATGRVVYRQLDMRHLAELAGSFDAAFCLWQSFGYFDEATNIDILEQISGQLKPQGRLILDVYHRGFFEKHQGRHTFERSGLKITETKFMSGHRLTVRLDYDHLDAPDRFEWQLYTPAEFRAIAEPLGLACLVVCANFDERQEASETIPRMQLVFEKGKFA